MKMRKLFDAVRAGFLGLLMACVSMAPVAAPAGLAIATSGCSAAEVETTIATVLQDLPTAIQIALSIATVVGAKSGGIDPSVAANITNWGGQIGSDFKLAGTLLTQYQANLAKAPASVLGELDTVAATVNSNLQSILSAIHVFDSNTQADIGIAVTGVDSVLLGLESIIPASASAQFPKMAAALMARGRQLGAIKAQVPTPRHLAKTFNAGIGKDFPGAKVSVPKLHFLGIPV
jgi:hypothetical protein